MEATRWERLLIKRRGGGETWQSSTPTEAHLSYVVLQSKNIQQSLGVLIKENKWKKEAETHIFNLLLPAAEMRLRRNQKKTNFEKI